MPPEVQGFLESISVWTLIGWVTAAVILYGMLRKLWPLLKRLSDFLDDVGGEPARPGVPARPGLMERVQRIEHEVFPNSGASMRDAINRTERKVTEVQEKLANDDKRIRHLDQIARKHHPEDTEETP